MRWLYGLFLLMTCIYYFNNSSKISVEGNELTESRKHRLLEELMLADPSTGKIPAGIRSKELAYYKKYFGTQSQYRSAEWQSVGPVNVGGRTRAGAIDIKNEKHIIAAGVSGGIWNSQDGGLTWDRASDPKNYMGAISISQDTRLGMENTWYALTGEASGNSASGGGAYYLGDGVWKSDDNGNSWTPLPNTATGTPASFSTNFQVGWRIDTHPSTDSEYVFAACYGIIYKSNNGGESWSISLGNNANNAYYTDLQVSPSGVIYATMSSDGNIKGIFRSADIGKSWTNITPTNILKSYDRIVMDISPNDENIVYFLAYLPDSTNSVGTQTSNYQGTKEYIALLKYQYYFGNGTNSGGAWSDLSMNLPNDANVNTGKFDKLNFQGGYNMLVKVQPTTNEVIVGGTNLYISSDGFTTPNHWRQFGGYQLGTGLPRFEIWPNHHPDNHDLLFFQSDSRKIISLCDGGVYQMNNVNDPSASWISLNNGYTTTQPYAVTLAPDMGSKWLLAGFQDNGNFVTNNLLLPKQAWNMPFNGDGGYGYIAPGGAYFVMSIQEGRLGKFLLDANGNVINRERIDPAGATRDDYVFINPFAVDPTDNNILYVPAGKKIFRQNKLNDLPITGKWDSISDGYTLLSDTIKAANTSSGFPAQITCIAVSNQPSHIVYIGTSRRDIYRIDQAHTGNPAMKLISKNPLPVGFVSGIAIDPDDANKVLVCYSNYVIRSLYYTTDGGDTWSYVGGNLDKTTNFTGTGPSVRTVGIMKTPDGRRKYFAGTSIGLFTTDTLLPTNLIAADTTLWIQESTQGIGTSVVNHLYIRPSDYRVAISTHGNGVYTSQYFPAPVILPDTFNYQLYPNPTIHITSLFIDLPQTTTMKCALIDMNGNQLWNAQLKDYQAGAHRIDLPFDQFSRGTYLFLYQDSEGRNRTTKLILK
jgi:photosystem II stability/assembly factor-like uncharacterized protein